MRVVGRHKDFGRDPVQRGWGPSPHSGGLTPRSRFRKADPGNITAFCSANASSRFISIHEPPECMRTLPFISLVVILAVLLAAAGCTRPSTPPVTPETAGSTSGPLVAPAGSETLRPAVVPAPPAPQTSREIKDFVDSAAAWAQKEGRDAALDSFSNTSGPLVAGDVYIYALDYAGRALALPFQPGLVGTDFENLTDASGRYYTRTEIQLAKDGGGYLLYQYPDPAGNFTVRYKISYVRPVDDTYWIGAGIYTSGDRLIDQDLRQFVADAKTYETANGRVKALAEFNNPNGSFARGDLYIFAYDYNGTTLAWPYRPDQIGVNRLDATDLTGTRHIRAMISTARNGSGMVEYYSVNPSTNTTQLKISYVTDVDGTWLLGSGRYMEPGQAVLRG